MGRRRAWLLEAGDEVDLQLITTGVGFGDFVGLKLRFESFGIDVDGDGEVQAAHRRAAHPAPAVRLHRPGAGDGVVDLANCTRCDAHRRSTSVRLDVDD